MEQKDTKISPEQSQQLSDILEVATQAGHILLENGAEISRVEETMERIASYYGADDSHFFVLSNGIFTTGSSNHGQAHYANVEYIPMKGAQLDRVVAVNGLSREICQGHLSVSQAKTELKKIRKMNSKGPIEQILGSAFGSAGFCAIFGGCMTDCLASLVAGALLWVFYLYICGKMSKMLTNILCSTFVSILCIFFYEIGFGHGLNFMLIGSIIPLIPGIAFTNGIRDIANGDYLAGTTRLLDALLVFFCIAMGVTIAFVGYSHILGGMVQL